MKCLRIATQNAHKLREFREMLEPLGYTVLGTEGLDGFAVVEDGATFAANALKKAAALTALTNDAAIADDSGLVVDALDGAMEIRVGRHGSVGGAAQMKQGPNSRTSTVAHSAAGTSPAIATASSRVAQSTTKKPPTISFASENGPSVSVRLPARTCTRTPSVSVFSDCDARSTPRACNVAENCSIRA